MRAERLETLRLALPALPAHLQTWLKWGALEAVAGFLFVWLLAPGLPAWRYALALVVLPVLFDCACRRVAWQSRRR